MVVKITGLLKPVYPTVAWDPELKSLVVKEKNKSEESKLGQWMFLFIDLILVAFVSKCTRIIENCEISLHTIMFTTSMVTVMFTTRLQLDDYCNRFYTNDLFHRVLYFAYTMCVFVMALNINVVQTDKPSDEACQANMYGYGFGVSFVITRGIIFILYASAIWFDKTKMVGKQFAMDLWRSGISAFFAFVQDLAVNEGGLYSPNYRFNIYVSCMVIELAFYIWHYIALYYQDHIDAWGFTFQDQYFAYGEYLIGKESYPADIEQYDERMSGFVMVILGEVMITTLVQYYNVKSAEATYDFTIISLWVVFLYGVLYYDTGKPEPPPEDPDKEKEKEKGESDEEKKRRKREKKARAEEKVNKWKSENKKEESEEGKGKGEEETGGSNEDKDKDKDKDEDNRKGKEGGDVEKGEGTSGTDDSDSDSDAGSVNTINTNKSFLSTALSAISAMSAGTTTSATSDASSRADTLPEEEEGEGGASEESHALNHSLLSSFLYTWTHLLLALSMFYTNAAIAVIYEQESDLAQASIETGGGGSSSSASGNDSSGSDSSKEGSELATAMLSRLLQEASDSDDMADDKVRNENEGDHSQLMTPQVLLSTSIAMAVLAMLLLSLLHDGVEQLRLPKERGGGYIRRSVLLKMSFALGHLLIPAFGIEDGAGLCSAHATLLMISVLIQVRFESGVWKSPDELLKESMDGTGGEGSPNGAMTESAAAIHGGAVMTENPMHSRRGFGARQAGTSSAGAFGARSSSSSSARIPVSSEESLVSTKDKLTMLAKRRKAGMKSRLRAMPATSANTRPVAVGVGRPPPTDLDAAS